MKLDAQVSLNGCHDCPRCSLHHYSYIGCTPFKEAIAGGFTHFFLCPTTNQPVLIRLLGESDGESVTVALNRLAAAVSNR